MAKMKDFRLKVKVDFEMTDKSKEILRQLIKEILLDEFPNDKIIDLLMQNYNRDGIARALMQNVKSKREFIDAENKQGDLIKVYCDCAQAKDLTASNCPVHGMNNIYK